MVRLRFYWTVNKIKNLGIVKREKQQQQKHPSPYN